MTPGRRPEHGLIPIPSVSGSKRSSAMRDTSACALFAGRNPTPKRRGVGASGPVALGARPPMIVLVDTSVWIRFLANKPPYAPAMDALLSRDEVSGHEFVYGELLIGDKGGRRTLLAHYQLMHQAPVVPHGDVVRFVGDRRLHGRGVGWIDAHLLASALVGRLQLWTADPRLSALAIELGVAYD